MAMRRRGRSKSANRNKAPKVLSTQTVSVEISRWGAQGDGIADFEDSQLYVPGSVVGDAVMLDIQQLSNGKQTVRLKSIDVPSPDRIEPVCEHFGDCGGCTLQMLGNQAYANWTQSRIEAALRPHNIEAAEVLPIIVSSDRSRRRIALKARKTASGTVLGYTQEKSHTIVDVVDCPIASPALTKLLSPLRGMLNRVLTSGAQCVVHLTDTATGIDLMLEGAVTLDLELRELLTAFAAKHDLAAFHVKDDGFLDPVIIRRPPQIILDGVPVEIPPASFLQATSDGEAALIESVAAQAVQSGKAVDLFAGLGTFSLPLARSMTVHAVEGHKPALEALSRAAGRAGDRPITTEHRDLFRRPLTAKELKPYDVAVFDPPRAGAEAQVQELAQSDIPTIVGISCNPNTFGRDAAILTAGGYQMVSLQPVDQFLWSSHLELAAVFRGA